MLIRQLRNALRRITTAIAIFFGLAMLCSFGLEAQEERYQFVKADFIPGDIKVIEHSTIDNGRMSEDEIILRNVSPVSQGTLLFEFLENSANAAFTLDFNINEESFSFKYDSNQIFRKEGSEYTLLHNQTFSDQDKTTIAFNNNAIFLAYNDVVFYSIPFFAGNVTIEGVLTPTNSSVFTGEILLTEQSLHPMIEVNFVETHIWVNQGEPIAVELDLTRDNQTGAPIEVALGTSTLTSPHLESFSGQTASFATEDKTHSFTIPTQESSKDGIYVLHIESVFGQSVRVGERSTLVVNVISNPSQAQSNPILPGDIRFIAFDNDIGNDNDKLTLTNLSALESGASFQIATGYYNTQQNIFNGPNGASDKIAAKEVTYHGSTPLEPESLICFETTSGENGSITNLLVNGIPSGDFSISNVGASSSNSVELPTTGEAPFLFIVSGTWTHDNSGSMLLGRVLDAIAIGNTWDTSNIPNDVDCNPIQGPSNAGSWWGFYDCGAPLKRPNSDLFLDIGNESNWTIKPGGNINDFESNGLNICSEDCTYCCTDFTYQESCCTIELINNCNVAIDVRWERLDVPSGKWLPLSNANTEILDLTSLSIPFEELNASSIRAKITYDNGCEVFNMPSISPSYPIVFSINSCSIEAEIIGQDIERCNTSSYQWFYSKEGGFYQLIADANTSIIDAQVDGFYKVEITLNSGCIVSMEEEMSGCTDCSEFQATFTASEKTICQSESTVLSIDASSGLFNDNFSYEWPRYVGLEDTEISSQKIVSPSQTATYVVTITNDYGCVIEKELEIVVKEQPTFQIIPTSNVTCGDEDVVLIVSTDCTTCTVTWPGESTPSDVNSSHTISVDQTEQFEVILTTADNCSKTETILLQHRDIVASSIEASGPDVCGAIKKLQSDFEIPENHTPFYKWLKLNNGSYEEVTSGWGVAYRTFEFEVSDQSENYRLEIELRNNLTNSTSVLYCVLSSDYTSTSSLPELSITSASIPLCEGVSQDVNLNATAVSTGGIWNYSWKKNGELIEGESGTNLTINAAVNDQFEFIATSTEYPCESSASLIVTSASAPTVEITGNLNYCYGGETLLTANASGGTGNYTYTWSNDWNESTFVPELNIGEGDVVTQDVFVQVMDENGCVSSDVVTLTMTKDPRDLNINYTLNGDDPIPVNQDRINVCEREALNFNILETGYTWIWYNNENEVVAEGTTFDIPEVSLSLTNDYKVVGRHNVDGCWVEKRFEIRVIDAPEVVSIDGADYCSGTQGTNLTPTVMGGAQPYTFEWYLNGSLVSTDRVLSSNVVNVGNSVNTLEYNLIVSDDNNCLTEFSKTVNVYPVPTNFTGNYMINSGPSTGIIDDVIDVCSDNNLTIELSQDDIYTWVLYNPYGVSNTVYPFNVILGEEDGGAFYAIGTTDEGCEARYDFNINVSPSFQVAVDNGFYCGTYSNPSQASRNNGTRLIVKFPDQTNNTQIEDTHTYLWSDGGTERINWIDAPAIEGEDQVLNYSVTVTDENGCVSTANTTVSVYAPPVADISNKDGTDIEEFCGGITFTYQGHESRNRIEFSIDGGETYPYVYTVTENANSVDELDLQPEEYDVWVRWEEGFCPVQLDNDFIVDANDCPCVYRWRHTCVDDEAYAVLKSQTNAVAGACQGGVLTTPSGNTYLMPAGNNQEIVVSNPLKVEGYHTYRFVPENGSPTSWRYNTDYDVLCGAQKYYSRCVNGTCVSLGTQACAPGSDCFSGITQEEADAKCASYCDPILYYSECNEEGICIAKGTEYCEGCASGPTQSSAIANCAENCDPPPLRYYARCEFRECVYIGTDPCTSYPNCFSAETKELAIQLCIDSEICPAYPCEGIDPCDENTTPGNYCCCNDKVVQGCPDGQVLIDCECVDENPCENGDPIFSFSITNVQTEWTCYSNYSSSITFDVNYEQSCCEYPNYYLKSSAHYWNGQNEEYELGGPFSGSVDNVSFGYDGFPEMSVGDWVDLRIEVTFASTLCQDLLPEPIVIQERLILEELCFQDPCSQGIECNENTSPGTPCCCEGQVVTNCPSGQFLDEFCNCVTEDPCEGVSPEVNVEVNDLTLEQSDCQLSLSTNVDLDCLCEGSCPSNSKIVLTTKNSLYKITYKDQTSENIQFTGNLLEIPLQGCENLNLSESFIDLSYLNIDCDQFPITISMDVESSIIGDCPALNFVSPTSVGAIVITKSQFNNCTSCNETDLCANFSAAITDNQEICPGDEANILVTVQNGAQPIQYTWSNGENGPSQNVSPSATTTYTVTVEDENSCEDILSTEVVVIEGPDFDLVASAEDLCEPGVISIFVENISNCEDCTFLWDGGETSPNISRDISQTTDFEVQVTSANGCVQSKTIEVPVKDLLSVSVSPNNVNVTCEESVRITADIDGNVNSNVLINYTWLDKEGVIVKSGEGIDYSYIDVLPDFNDPNYRLEISLSDDSEYCIEYDKNVSYLDVNPYSGITISADLCVNKYSSVFLAGASTQYYDIIWRRFDPRTGSVLTLSDFANQNAIFFTPDNVYKYTAEVISKTNSSCRYEFEAISNPCVRPVDFEVESTFNDLGLENSTYTISSVKLKFSSYSICDPNIESIRILDGLGNLNYNSSTETLHKLSDYLFEYEVSGLDLTVSSCYYLPGPDLFDFNSIIMEIDYTLCDYKFPDNGTHFGTINGYEVVCFDCVDCLVLNNTGSAVSNNNRTNSLTEKIELKLESNNSCRLEISNDDVIRKELPISIQQKVNDEWQEYKLLEDYKSLSVRNGEFRIKGTATETGAIIYSNSVQINNCTNND